MVYKSPEFSSFLVLSCTQISRPLAVLLLENILNFEQVMLLNLTAAFMNLILTKHMRMSEERLYEFKHLYSIFMNYIVLGFPWSYLAINLPGKQYFY